MSQKSIIKYLRNAFLFFNGYDPINAMFEEERKLPQLKNKVWGECRYRHKPRVINKINKPRRKAKK